jgi:hypothetical protein
VLLEGGWPIGGRSAAEWAWSGPEVRSRAAPPMTIR